MSAPDDTNPYASNPKFSVLEGAVLWEYHKLSTSIKKFNDMKRDPVQPHDQLLAVFRGLEKKMGLVLTLYKASVWATMVDGEQDMLNRQAEEAARLDAQDRQARRDQGLEDDSFDSEADQDRTIQDHHTFKGWGNV